MDLQSYYQIIENAISQIGIDPALCRAKNDAGQEVPGQWNLKKGEQSVWVDLWYIEKEQRAYFQVLAPMMDVPANISPAFYRELLEINYDLYGVAFVISRDKVYIKIIREADGMDSPECLASIYRVGNYASHYDPILREKYFTNKGPGNAPDFR